MASIEAARKVRPTRSRRLFLERASFGDMRESEILSRYRLTREGLLRLVNILK